MIALWQILTLAMIIAITWFHKKRFDANKPVGPWWHFWWSCVYGIPAGVIAWHYHSYWLAAAFVLERFVFYNWILNLRRGRAFFYVVSKNSKPGFWDKIYTWFNKFYPYIWGAGVICYIIIQFFI